MFGGVKSRELTSFTRQLSILQDAGLPILRKKVTGNLPISRIIIAILGAAFSLLIVITLNRYNFLAAAIALALGALIYFLSARRLLNQTV